MKKKVKRVLITMIFAVALLYFAFTQLFFSPFEDDFGPIEYIVPREVDFFSGKVNLFDDFRSFPEPEFYPDLKACAEWRSFRGTELYSSFCGQRDPDIVFQEIRNQIKDLPIDFINDIVGREVAVAGSFSDDGAMERFLLFFRGSLKTKFFFELLTWDFVRGMAEDPNFAESTVFHDERKFYMLTLVDGQSFYMKRCADLIVVGNDEKMMEEMSELVEMGSESIDLSLGGAQAYIEKVLVHAPEEGEELDSERDLLNFHVNLESLRERVSLDDEMKANDTDFSIMTMVDVFQPEFFRDLTGILDLGETVGLQARAELDRDAVLASKTGFFDRENFGVKKSMRRLAGMLPANVFLAGCARLRPLDFLTILEENMDPDYRKLLNDLIRESSGHEKWKVTATWELIEFLDATFGEMVYFALRPRQEDKTISDFVQPLPIFALIFEVEDHEKLAILEDVVKRLRNNSRSEFDMYKFKNDYYGCMIKTITPPEVDDVEHFAFTTMGSNYFVLTTADDFIMEIVKTWATSKHSLADTRGFRNAEEYLGKHGNLGLYMEMDGMRQTLDNYATYWGQVQTSWTEEEARAQRKKVRSVVMRREGFRGGRNGDLSEADEKRLVELVDEEMLKIRDRRIQTEGPKYAAEFREKCAWIDLFKSVMLSMTVKKRSMDIDIGLETLLSR